MADRRAKRGERKLLPRAMATGLRRMLFAGYGLVLAAIAGGAWLSLATWSIHDPSFNNATQAEPRNVLGSWGAIVADLAMQSSGLPRSCCSCRSPPGAGIWCCETVPERRARAAAALAAAVLMLAAALSALPQPRSWPLPNGLGGIIGDLFMAGRACARRLARRRRVYFVAGLVFLIDRHLAHALCLRHHRIVAHRALGAEDPRSRANGRTLRSAPPCMWPCIPPRASSAASFGGGKEERGRGDAEISEIAGRRREGRRCFAATMRDGRIEPSFGGRRAAAQHRRGRRGSTEEESDDDVLSRQLSHHARPRRRKRP